MTDISFGKDVLTIICYNKEFGEDTDRSEVKKLLWEKYGVIFNDLFAYRIRKRTDYKGYFVDLYIEDDGVLHLKETFDSYWVSDLLKTTNELSDKLKRL